MSQKIYQVDAFADAVFSGNPAAVCPLEQWPDDRLLQQMAMEHNLAETAFYVKSGNQYEIRWFTPTVEVDLCGHATLATAYVLFHHENHEGDAIRFYSGRSGALKVTKNEDFLTLDFPADSYRSVDGVDDLDSLCGVAPIAAFRGKTDYMLVFENEADIRNAVPDFDRIAKLKGRGLIITARGAEVDFVSRFFAPQSGINEDPVTGSAHTTLTPYWAKQLGKDTLTARQLSARGGYLQCRNAGNRVEISGQARLYMIGEIFL